MKRYDLNALESQGIFDVALSDKETLDCASVLEVVGNIKDRFDEIRLIDKEALLVNRKDISVGQIKDLRDSVLLADGRITILEEMKTVVCQTHKKHLVHKDLDVKSFLYITHEINTTIKELEEHKEKIFRHLDHGLCKRVFTIVGKLF